MAKCERINAKFAQGNWQPIVLIDEHQEPVQVFELYRAADFCLVNSLHDGMNLVAKEFVAARDDEDGVLILSTFAGASRELLGGAAGQSLRCHRNRRRPSRCAMRMARDERRKRMSLMRRTVKENNVYRWAGRMLMDAARIRQAESPRAPLGTTDRRDQGWPARSNGRWPRWPRRRPAGRSPSASLSLTSRSGNLGMVAWYK